MNYEIISRKINTEYGTSIDILKFGEAQYNVVKRDDDSGNTVSVVICKTLAMAEKYEKEWTDA